MAMASTRSSPRGTLALIIGATLLALLLVGCGQAEQMAAPEIEIGLDSALLSDGRGGRVFRVGAEIVDPSAGPLSDLTVLAEIWDAGDKQIGELVCTALPESPGLYQSGPFVPPLAAEAGEWRIQVTASKGSRTISAWQSFAVTDVNQWAAEEARGAQQDAGQSVTPAPTADHDGGGAGGWLVLGALWARLAPEGGEMPATGPLLFAALVTLGVMVAFVGVWRIARPLDPIEERMQEYGLDGEMEGHGGWDAEESTKWGTLNRALGRMTLGQRLAENLAQADLPLTAAEFALICLATGGAGFVLGAWSVGPLAGLVLGAVLIYIPITYLNGAKSRRQRAFTAQLPDILTLLVGALRAGYGLSQALQVLVDQLPPPACKEFERVMRAIGLGTPLQEALRAMSERIGTDDVHLVITAINVQYEIGGNLAETLDTIGETIRDRLRMQREIEVLTSEERLTGY